MDSYLLLFYCLGVAAQLPALSGKHVDQEFCRHMLHTYGRHSVPLVILILARAIVVFLWPLEFLYLKANYYWNTDEFKHISPSPNVPDLLHTPEPPYVPDPDASGAAWDGYEEDFANWEAKAKEFKKVNEARMAEWEEAMAQWREDNDIEEEDFPPLQHLGAEDDER